jgi:hypothetical protein
MDRLAQGIDAYAFHRTQINDQAPLADTTTGNIVTATAHGHEQMGALDDSNTHREPTR